MASTLLEQTRAGHDDCERLERLVAKELKQEAKTHKEKLLQSHRVRRMLDTMQQRSKRLVEIYDDRDYSRREDIASLRGENVFSNFYDRLKELRDYHRRHGAGGLDLTEAAAEAEAEAASLRADPDIDFSGEEGFGRFLDLIELHQAYMNSKFGQQVDYLTYLRSVTKFSELPPHHRCGKVYKEYLAQLLAYLISFYERTQPLGSLEKAFAKLDEDFAERWERGEVLGWTVMGTSTTALPAPGSLDLDAFSSPEELLALGPDRLKLALQALGLKCGGTPQQRAERLFATKGKSPDQIDKRLFAKGVLPVEAGGDLDAVRGNPNAREAALLEARVMKVLELLPGVLRETIARTEKRQAQTYEELLAEQEEAEAEVAEQDSDDDEPIYNPLKIELGPDGKPIPYWLWKLHGLNREFQCEICGGASYKGRRAFERHFREAAHQAGMNALGIPNSKHFFEVVKIAEAQSLWEELQSRNKGGFKADDEEFEDAAGNVYNKKTYEDLKRQGLL